MKDIKKIFAIEIVFLLLIIAVDVVVVARENESRPLVSPIPERILGINVEGPAATLNEQEITRGGVWPKIAALSPSPTPSETSNPQRTLSKNSYSVAVFGDSMEDTMGTNLDYLNTSLRKKYPGVNFSFYNYGIGSQNVDDGLNRVCQKFDYKDRHYPSLCDLKPDVLIVGSFAYNPFSPYDRNRHWLRLANLVEGLRNVSGNIYLLAEIAPLKQNFGLGPAGINWQRDAAVQQSVHINEQLKNAVGLAGSLGIPLIDAYDATINVISQEGNRGYVNPGDGIHPSVSGHIFMADLMADKISIQ